MLLNWIEWTVSWILFITLASHVAYCSCKKHFWLFTVNTVCGDPGVSWYSDTQDLNKTSVPNAKDAHDLTTVSVIPMTAGAREPFFNRGVKVKNHLFDISEVSIFWPQSQILGGQLTPWPGLPAPNRPFPWDWYLRPICVHCSVNWHISRHLHRFLLTYRIYTKLEMI